MHHLDVNGANLAVLTRGEQGYPLLLVHGFPLNHTLWQPQIDYLADHCRVIAPDLRGFGNSTVTHGVVSMEQHADDLVALLDALDIRDKVIFCGLSMGGYVGWQFVRKYSDRVLALIACDTRAIPDTPEIAAGRHKLAAQVLKDGSKAAADVMMPRMFSEATVKNQPELVERVRHMMLSCHPAGIAAALEGMAIRPDSRPLLPTIDVPTLIIVGQHDSISTPTEMRQIADAIPNSAWLEAPNAGHLCQLENPTVVNEAIREFISVNPCP